MINTWCRLSRERLTDRYMQRHRDVQQHLLSFTQEGQEFPKVEVAPNKVGRIQTSFQLASVVVLQSLGVTEFTAKPEA